MRSKGTSPLSLYALAILAVLGLLLLSDFGPKPVPGLGALGEGDSKLTVMVMSSRACSGGQVLNLSDGRGGQAEAFCPTSVWPSSVGRGTVIEATLSRSSGDPDFLIIQALAVVEPPAPKD